jgi:aspartyl-tRNA(Asn)/glutamyl-tRNA(Gln) amidotransferase subunit B
MGLRQVSDEDTLRAIVRDVIRDNPGPVQQYRDGKTKVLGFLMGQVMKQSRGKAQPAAASQLLREELEK